MTALHPEIESLVSACGNAAPPAQTARGQRTLVRVLPCVAVGLMAISAGLPGLLQRGHYSDDYPNRIAVQEYGIAGACQHYRAAAGWFRPLGYVSVMTTQAMLWDRPQIQQLGLLTMWGAICVLLSVLVSNLHGNRGTGLVAGALLAVWPAATPLIAWVAAGAQMLPAYGLLLLSLIAFHRYLVNARKSWWIASFASFAVSILFHDQHLGAAAAFSIMAMLLTARTRRFSRVCGTIPFWLASTAVGVTALITTQGSARPLNPSLWDGLARLASFTGRFLAVGLVTPIRDSLNAAGPAASISRMASRDSAGLLLFAIIILGGLGTLLAFIHRDSTSKTNVRVRCAGPAIGLTILLAGVFILAAKPGGGFQPRHSVLPAIGLAILVAPIVTRLRPLAGRLAAPLLAALLLTLGAMQAGYTYDWSIRTRVTEQLLADLAHLCPEVSENEVIYIHGLLGYGRGFNDSWGLSGALTLQRGMPLRVATKIRRQDDMLYANAEWDEPWLIDPAATRCFQWDQQTETLAPASANILREL